MSWYTSKQQGHLSKRFMSISLSLNGGQGSFRKDFFSCLLALISTVFLYPHQDLSDEAFGKLQRLISRALFRAPAFISLIKSDACPFPDVIPLTRIRVIFFNSESCRIKRMSRRFENVPMIPTLKSWCNSESRLVSIYVASFCSFSPNVTADGRRAEDWSRDDVLAGVHADLPASHAAAQRKWNVCWHCVGTFSLCAASTSNLAQKICLCRFSASPSRYFSCRPGRQNRNIGIVSLCKTWGDLKCERFIRVTSTV